MARGDIHLHPEYGLNPTMPVCFWCGKSKGEIALLGNRYKGEAPRSMIMDYEPCASCQAGWEQGITFIEMHKSPPDALKDAPAMAGQGWPSGRLFVVTEEGFINTFGNGNMDTELYEHILAKRICFVEPEVFNNIRPQED